MKSKIILFICLVLAGCSGSPAGMPKKQYLQDGSTGWVTSCLNTTSGCYEKAYKMCPRGIKILELSKGDSLITQTHILQYKCK